ncbi:MAG: DinB family protein [Candidatus Dormibacteria bacterium]
MKNESRAFTAADVPRFFDELRLEEAANLADRLRAGSARLQQLAARVPEDGGQAEGWNAKEILAHVAVFSRAYGVFAYMIARGRLPQLELAAVINQRDTFGEEMVKRSVAEIVGEAVEQHQKTLAFLEKATPAQLAAECRVEDGTVTPELLIRLPLVAHLEQHLRHLEAELERRAPGAA